MSTPVLQFEETTHTYSVDGRVVPSVTQVLEDCGIIDYSMIPGDTRQMALERGRHVHAAAQFDDEEALEESSVTEEIFPYLIGWRRFRAEVPLGAGPFDMIETRGHHGYGFAGTLDRSWKPQYSPTRIILDIKTSAAPWWVRLQLAAYAAIFDFPGCRRIAVELHRDSTYKVIEFPIAEQKHDFQTFIAALRVWQEKTQHSRRGI